MNDRNYKYLDKIDLPKDLRKFEKNDLEKIYAMIYVSL